jgi:hypothetical protein
VILIIEFVCLVSGLMFSSFALLSVLIWLFGSFLLVVELLFEHDVGFALDWATVFFSDVDGCFHFHVGVCCGCICC